MEYKEYLDIINKFRKLLRDLPNIQKRISDTIHDADSAFGDIRHKLELDYPTTRKERTAICKAIKDYSIERRKAKNEENVVKELYDLSVKYPKLANDLDDIAGKMNKAIKDIEKDRVYHVRILNNMFGDEINANI